MKNTNRTPLEEEMLAMLEELLSITEDAIKHETQGGSETRKTWQRLSARTADLRDGEDV